MIYDPSRPATGFQIYATQHRLRREEEKAESARKEKRAVGFGKTAWQTLEAKRLEDMREAERLYNIRSPYTKTGRKFKYAEPKPKASTWKEWYKNRYKTSGRERVVRDTDLNKAGLARKEEILKERDIKLSDIKTQREGLPDKYGPYQFTDTDQAEITAIGEQAAQEEWKKITGLTKEQYQKGSKGQLVDGKRVSSPEYIRARSRAESTLGIREDERELPNRVNTEMIDERSLPTKTPEPVAPTIKTPVKDTSTQASSLPFPDAGTTTSVSAPATDIAAVTETSAKTMETASIATDAVETAETAAGTTGNLGNVVGTAGNLMTAYKTGATLLDKNLSVEQKAVRTAGAAADIASTKAITTGVATGNPLLAGAGVAWKGLDMLGATEAIEEWIT